MIKASALASYYLDFKTNNLKDFNSTLLPYSFFKDIIQEKEYQELFDIC